MSHKMPQKELLINKSNNICKVFFNTFEPYLKCIRRLSLAHIFIDDNFYKNVIFGKYDDMCDIIIPVAEKIRLECIEKYNELDPHKRTWRNRARYDNNLDAIKTCNRCNKPTTSDECLHLMQQGYSKSCLKCRGGWKLIKNDIYIIKCDKCVN